MRAITRSRRSNNFRRTWTRHGHEKTSEHRPDRLRLHGPHPLERLSQVSATSSTWTTARSSRRSAAATPRTPRRSPTKWGYESIETDWRKLVERKDIDADRHLHAQRHARRDRHRRRQGRQDDPLREAAGANARRSAADGRGRREGRRAQHRLVQLPPRPGRHAGQAAHRRGPAGQDLPLPRQLPAGLDDLRRPAPGRRGPLAARRRRRRLGVTGDLLAHCIDTALWLNGVDRQRSPR